MSEMTKDRRSRVFVTGDLHGTDNIGRLSARNWPEGAALSRDDYLVVCGDFGLVWSDPPDSKKQFCLDWLDNQPWTTLFVDGNHENHDLLDTMPVTEWHGGKVHVVPGYPNIVHLMRGQVYDMDENGRWFVLGGAASMDKARREPGVSWWERELPSDDEYDEATRNLSACRWAVDYVFTHDCPLNIRMSAIGTGDAPDSVDRLGNFLQYVDESLDRDRLRMWYFGHYHRDLALGDRHSLLYHSIVELGEEPARYEE